MAWIYLAESEGSLRHYDPTSFRWPIVKTIDMPKPSFSPECIDLKFLSPRSGMTLRLCIKSFFLLWTSSMEDSLARISALQDADEVWKASEAVYTGRSIDSLVSAVPPSSSSKMSRRSEPVDLNSWFDHLPISGMTVAGRLYRPPRLEPRISGNDGSFLPTPTAVGYGSNQGGAAGRVGKKRHSLQSMVANNLWPTPTVYGNHQAPKAGTSRGIGLSTAVKRWPTPRASDGAKGVRTPEGAAAEKIRKGGGIDLPTAAGGGQLNPAWVEWLMGYRCEATVLEDWATQWFLSKRKSRMKG